MPQQRQSEALTVRLAVVRTHNRMPGAVLIDCHITPIIIHSVISVDSAISNYLQYRIANYTHSLSNAISVHFLPSRPIQWQIQEVLKAEQKTRLIISREFDI